MGPSSHKRLLEFNDNAKKKSNAESELEIDMFAEEFEENQDLKKVERKFEHSDSWDDSEGYYISKVGEIMNGNLKVTSLLGKGVFSTVVRALDMKENIEVAVKIMRNNDLIRNAGLTEVKILEILKSEGRTDTNFIVGYHGTFEFRNHLCLIFESLSMNLRDLLKKFGKNVGLNISAVRVFGKQLLLALRLLEKCKIIHADIKPDNILVSEAKNFVKLADLGAGCELHNRTVVQYVGSRFYRAPEIILGLEFDTRIDLWALACTLYEIYTGKVLFPGGSNNEMLYLMMELKGKFSHKMLRKGKFSEQFFDYNDNYSFLKQEIDGVTKQKYFKKVYVSSPKKFFKDYFEVEIDTKDSEAHLHFMDLIEKCLALNPEKRISLADCLQHPFFQNK